MTTNLKTIAVSALLLLPWLTGTNAFAAKEVFQRTKPHVNIGTIGHIDHGKSELIWALAKANEVAVETLVLQSEGFAIEGDEDQLLNRATWELSSGICTVDDLAGNASVWGAGAETGAYDAAILVVSAVEGLLPQTREHILLARQAGVPVMVVFLNLDGIQDIDQMAQAEQAVRLDGWSDAYTINQTIIISGSVSQALRGTPDGLRAMGEVMDALEAISASR